MVQRSTIAILGPLAALLLAFQAAAGGEKTVISLRDFETEEVKYAGLTLKADARVTIRALGDGFETKKVADVQMFAYGWILDAGTRQSVWTMDLRNTTKAKNGREAEETINLPKGDYEVYFAVYAFGASNWFTNYYINIDRREAGRITDTTRKRGVFSWFEDFFGEDVQKDWKERARRYGIDVALDERAGYSTFKPPRERANVVFRSTGAGERARVRTGLDVTDTVELGIYCIGEIGNDRALADFGWIIDRSSRARVWEMTRRNCTPAGGAKKNVLFDGTVKLPGGKYLLNYVTDDSHSAPDWNSAPPEDPLNYGITVYLPDPKARGRISLSSGEERDDALVSLARVGDDEFRSANFSLKKQASLRVYAIGERMYSRSRMADYGWIINARTREKVWEMDPDRTEPAGGSEKNRMIDEVITLPAGTYTVFYSTDDSHSYNDWNSGSPIDEEHYGITIYPPSDHFDRGAFVAGGEGADAGVIAQIVRVKDGEHRKASFALDRRARVRVYALGEGQNREMFDYGWIEKAGEGVVWEMTYTMTFSAGGAKKNRMVNTTITLEPGSYTLHYRTDDSHSYGDWNSDPPDDPTMWGITLYRDDQQ